MGHIILGIGLLDYKVNGNKDNLKYVSNLIGRLTLNPGLVERFMANPEDLFNGTLALILPRITEKEIWEHIDKFIEQEKSLAVAL